MKPTDDELAVMYRWTMHTKRGYSGFMGEGGDLDFTCRCERCTETRRKRWEKEKG